uniref:Uncharacterized protein n=1 Tax=Panagrolaimus davidi TaxID=227884 RepID=A0A914PNU2_9BILA
MKLLIFALVFGVILLQAMATPIERWKNEQDEIDSAELHRTIKNVEKVEMVLKAVEASQKLEKMALRHRDILPAKIITDVTEFIEGFKYPWRWFS